MYAYLKSASFEVVLQAIDEVRHFGRVCACVPSVRVERVSVDLL